MARARKTDVLVIRLEQVEAALTQVYEAVRRLRADLDELTGTSMPPTPEVAKRTGPTLRVLPPPEPGWIPILHRMQRADPQMPTPCGGVGLYLTKPPRQHERARTEVMRILPPNETTWRAPGAGDLPRCATCLVRIDPFSSADLDYLSVMQPSPSSDPSQPTPAMSTGYPLQTPPPETVLDELPQPHRPFPAHTREAAEADLESIRELSDAIGPQTESGLSS